ncbi:MAG: MOSC domain-containing protein [Gammaproteobacteria bacterium]|nr:MOSC domain-containing protein [Gammaproteobacteria bacterium]
MNAKVVAVSRSARHSFTKPNCSSIQLISGLGVEGDAHAGKTVKHRSRVAQDPTQPNLRQVHLIHIELHHELAAAGFNVSPGAMGENITTSGIDLLALAEGTRLRIGESAEVTITGLRNPCAQLDQIKRGLMKATLGRDAHGNLIRKAGVMGVVTSDGIINPGDPIVLVGAPQAHRALQPV